MLILYPLEDDYARLNDGYPIFHRIKCSDIAELEKIMGLLSNNEFHEIVGYERMDFAY